jgi:hypothetical protein
MNCIQPVGKVFMKIFNITYLSRNDIFKTLIFEKNTEDAVRVLTSRLDGELIITKISYAQIPARPNEFNEFVISVYVDGKKQKGAEYYATDKEDAIITAEAMIRNY